MNEALSITRRKPEQKETGFDSLRSEAIELIQQISGQVWTDYNLHDPGITILEQLVYSLTELIYRSEFAIADYLANEDGSIDYKALGLAAPEVVFPCRATTGLDYRKLLLNAVPEADNVWVEPIPRQSPESDYRGLYRLSVKLVQGLSQQERNQAIDKLRATYQGSRNLCEDLGEIRVVENLEYQLCASIEVGSERRPGEILAEIYFACARRIASSVTVTGYDQLVGQLPPLEELFDGPFTGHGIFLQDELHQRQSEFLVSNLFTVINSIDGVDHIRQLYLSRGDERYYDQIGPIAADSALDLRVPLHAAEIRVELTTNGRVLPITLEEFAARYDEISTRHLRSRSTPQDLSLLYQSPTGSARPWMRYFSIQNQFPAGYGINQLGVPDSTTAEVKAKVRQLKAYLVIFEQLLVNFLANLGAVKTLFSPCPEPKASYSVQVLNDRQIGDLGAVYPDDAADLSARIMAGFDNFHERKSRLLDYLLALYGERFSQNSLRHFNYYFSRDRVDEIIVANKIAYFASIIELGRDRGAALDYSHVASNSDDSGLARRCTLLLGFETPRSHTLTEAILEQGLEVCSHAEYQSKKAGSDELRLIRSDEIDAAGIASFEPSGPLIATQEVVLADIRQRLSDTIPFKNKLLNELLLRQGIDIERYQVARLGAAAEYELMFLIEQDCYWHLGSYPDRAAANDAAINLRQFLLRLNMQSEGLHVVEHILLRPRQQASTAEPGVTADDDFYSFRISVILPGWSVRCHDQQFRLLAEETLRLNAPAHVWPEIYWLEFAQMAEFERIYQRWLLLKRDPDSAEETLQQSARQLIAFLSEQHLAHQAGS
ncbi:MAG: hypothetical protein GY935_25355 [Gammaproteobacteria bacterium]|nr:hypothetical protein [Gammaproteobacteria bacterium]